MVAPDRPLSLLFVCTANVCRSPLAAALMVERARLAGVDVEVSSASVDNELREAHPLVIEILGEHGLTLRRTQSRPVSKHLVDGADLVLTMTAQHAISVAGRFREARPKVFMLADFAEVVGLRRHDELLEEWLAGIRRTARLYPAGPDPRDVPDPIGHDEATFREVAALIERLTDAIATALAGSPTHAG